MKIDQFVKSYFNGFSEISHYKENNQKKNTLAVIKLISYLTLFIPCLFGVLYLASLRGRMQKKGPLTPVDLKVSAQMEKVNPAPEPSSASKGQQQNPVSVPPPLPPHQMPKNLQEQIKAARLQPMDSNENKNKNPRPSINRLPHNLQEQIKAVRLKPVVQTVKSEDQPALKPETRPSFVYQKTELTETRVRVPRKAVTAVQKWDIVCKFSSFVNEINQAMQDLDRFYKCAENGIQNPGLFELLSHHFNQFVDQYNQCAVYMNGWNISAKNQEIEKESLQIKLLFDSISSINFLLVASFNPFLKGWLDNIKEEVKSSMEMFNKEFNSNNRKIADLQYKP